MADTFGIATYASDDVNSYALRLSHRHYDASGLANGSAGLPLYPKHWTPRMVHGKTSDGLHHASLPVNETSALWTGATNSFTISGLGTFTVTGRTGEKRPNLALPFS